MSLDRKKPKADIGKNYQVFLELGLIVVLALLIVAMKVEFRSPTKKIEYNEEQEVVKMKEVVRTQQQKQPPPPPAPTVPVEVPNETVIENQDINLDTDFDLNQKLTPPEPPQKPTGEGEGKKVQEPFVAVQHMPKLQMSRADLQSKVDYPRSCRMANIEGTVIVQFVVTTSGDLTDFRVVKGIGGGCDEAAVEAIKKYAKFSVGRQRGEAVPVRMSFPIVFRLQ